MRNSEQEIVLRWAAPWDFSGSRCPQGTPVRDWNHVEKKWTLELSGRTCVAVQLMREQGGLVL
eukprot:3543336-Amphidinium_carterae.1